MIERGKCIMVKSNPFNPKSYDHTNRIHKRNITPKSFPQKLNTTAHFLTTKLPKSEIWFHSLYQEFKDKQDKFNRPFKKYIPDVYNEKFKYIIEIDGSFHDSYEQQRKDWKKDKYFQKLGYKVFRLKAYDNQKFKETMIKLVRYRIKLK